MPEPQVRPLRDAELEELVELLCLVFGRPDGHERYRGYIEGDPTWRPEQTPVIVVDGRVVSALRIWDRQIYLGATPVRMGGIGGVCTHPDYRRRGLASRLMAHTCQVLRAEGYELGLLFTLVPARFYRRFGWCSVPLMGFRAELPRRAEPGRDAPEGPAIEPFEATRDLEETVALYGRYNGGRSGTVLRPRPYWDWAPSLVRGVRPTVVARDETGLVGYLNWRLAADEVEVAEVAWEGAAALGVLVEHLLSACAAAGVTRVRGDIPHTHAFVDALVTAADADLQPTGDGSMMALPVDLPALLDKVVPEASPGIRALPAELMCRLLFGETSGAHLEPVLRARGCQLDASATAELRELFARRDPIVWQPDHF